MHKETDLSSYVRNPDPKPDFSGLKTIIYVGKRTLFLFPDRERNPAYYNFSEGRENNGTEVKWIYTLEDIRYMIAGEGLDLLFPKET